MLVADSPEVQTLVSGLRSVGEASRIIRKSPAWTRHLAESGVLRGVRTPVGWLLAEESLLDYLRQQDAPEQPCAAADGGAA